MKYKIIYLLAMLLVFGACEDDTDSGQDQEVDEGTELIEEDMVEESDVDEDPLEEADAQGDADDDPASDVVEEEVPSILNCGLERRTFWTWDLSAMPPADVQVEAECVAWGPNVAVYATDDQWLVNMDETDPEAIVTAFEYATPADAERGIYPIVTGVFGDPPDVDGDPRIVLLYHSLGSYMGSSFDGFFRAKDEGSCGTCNHTEMLFLDSVHNDVSGEYMLSIIAHEFEHMIQYSHDGDETSWVNETLSEIAMVLCGYYTDVMAVNYFAGHTDTPLIVDEHPDYGAVFLFGLYIYEQLGETFVADFANEPANGTAGFDLTAEPLDTDFETVLADWFLANFLDDPDVEDGQYGYVNFELPNMSSTFNEADGVAEDDTVQGTAADYQLYFATGPGTLSFDFAGDDWEDLGLAALTYPESRDAGDATVTLVTLTGSTASVDIDVPAGHDRVTVVVYSTVAASAPYAYSYSATYE